MIVRTSRPIVPQQGDDSRAIDTVALIAVGIMFVSAVLWVALQPKPEYEMIEVVVRPGDTLWGLARQYAPDMDPREAVYIIRGANDGLDPGRLQPGDVVLVPSNAAIEGVSTTSLFYQTRPSKRG